MFTEPILLRSLAAAAAATAIGGAVVMRRWDTQAGKRVADLTRARASDEWRHEERIAELETDLEESRELRQKLEQRLRAKRAELAGLRNEHAALLRRYATAETERASALEGRRLLEIEAVSPAPALPPAATEPEQAEPEDAAEAQAQAAAEARAGDESGAAEEKPETPAVFSPEGSRLFLRAKAALSRFDGPARGDGTSAAAEDDGAGRDGEDGDSAGVRNDDAGVRGDGAPEGEAAGDGSAREDEAQGRPGAADGQQHAAAAGARADRPVQAPTGHFAVPTAVAVVPPAPARRPAAEGGFDFFGTKSAGNRGSGSALDTVQNEDLADVVGQEALALHKAETEAGFKPADEGSRGVGQVIDLTAHDETEQIDVEGLRSAAS
ncbi:hypothetical protein GCM10010129_35930 [Streptomyces fumigatiscleroticus]|nr:hypothetical protein GCM10010129_35930 [Streptomyces fumigatiscleroticus]